MSSRPLKILAFCPYYPPHVGGLEKYADELHRELAARGYQVTVFTPAIPPVSNYHSPINIQVIRFPAWDIIYNYPLPKFWLPSFWSILWSLYHEPYDTVLSTTRFFITSPLALLFARLKHIPWFHIEHGSDSVKSSNPIVATIAKLVDATIGRLVFTLSTANIAPSKSARQFIHRFNKRPVTVIYRGLPWSQIRAIAPDQTIKQRYPNKTIITFAGRFISGKGVKGLINAISLIKNNSLALLLIGDGPLRKELALLVKQLKLENTIFFLGQQTFNNTIAIIKSSDIAINPSYNEGLPTLVLEAAACHVPVIATDVGGTAEIITDRQSGLLVPAGDTRALAHALRQLIDQPTIRQQLSTRLYQTVQQQFDWAQAITQYENIFTHSR